MLSDMHKLGRLEPVDLRSVWASEAGDFTPWLASEQNLKLLGDTIGIELELEAEEKDVGPFRADILCRDTASDHWVLIENQLERTNHTHLGQLLTYATGLKAVTIVWIADDFTVEQRTALEWLNEITDDRFNFFGLEVELWRIGESMVAPKFNVVSKPNDWTNTVAKGAAEVRSSELTDARRMQLDFWVAFKEFVEKRGSQLKFRKPRPKYTLRCALGRTGFHLSAVASLWDTQNETFGSHELRAEVVIRCDDVRAFYRGLEEQRDPIERELGEQLHWYNPEGKRMSKMYMRQSGLDLNDRAKWQRHHEWLLVKLEALHRVFSPRVKTLDAEELQATEA